MKTKERKDRNGKISRRFSLFLIAGTAVILLIAEIISTVMEFVFTRFNILEQPTPEDSNWYLFFIFSGSSILIGVALALVLTRMLLKPINTLADGIHKLSVGDFSARIEPDKYNSLKKLAANFNTLAEELEKTEILRNDFVNEFSHELKTPIVSISGLISLLKSENLTEEKRQSYLAIMEEEAHRLTEMTSNALYLSKLETQTILTNKKKFNVSEQIRDSFLLLERKWSQKELIPDIEIEEFSISANEDMMKQVWVNLIDNAIKFSDKGREIQITAESMYDHLYVSIENYGPAIPESDYEAIFNKFYQCDKSRSTEGNGIGLSIVKHIITLHGGEVMASSRGGKTTFTVVLPMIS